MWIFEQNLQDVFEPVESNSIPVDSSFQVIVAISSPSTLSSAERLRCRACSSHVTSKTLVSMNVHTAPRCVIAHRFLLASDPSCDQRAQIRKPHHARRILSTATGHDLWIAWLQKAISCQSLGHGPNCEPAKQWWGSWL